MFAVVCACVLLGGAPCNLCANVPTTACWDTQLHRQSSCDCVSMGRAEVEEPLAIIAGSHALEQGKGGMKEEGTEGERGGGRFTLRDRIRNSRNRNQSGKPWSKFLCSYDTVKVACVLQIAQKIASMFPHAESHNAPRSFLARS